jgi:hypothetical protein
LPRDAGFGASCFSFSSASGIMRPSALQKWMPMHAFRRQQMVAAINWNWVADCHPDVQPE